MIASLVLSVLLVTTVEIGCGPRSDIIQSLLGMFGESLVSSGVSINGNIIETLVNKKTGTWSIILTRPMQPTCLVESGDGYYEVEKGSDA